MRRFWVLVVVVVALSPGARAQEITLPLKPDSLYFAVIGDSGTGGRPQYQVAQQMAAFRTKVPFELVLMLGDNIYGGKTPADFETKFHAPYQAILDLGVKFYAALGNHDDTNERFYKPFNMNERRYYSFKGSKGSIRFFALDSNYMDRQQLDWIDKEMQSDNSDWKICFLHHTLYSSGYRHGSSKELRSALEPVLLKFGVNVVFSGHEHFYERIKPQRGINYFVSGSAGQLAPGDIKKSKMTAKGFDRDNHFILVEVAGNEFYYQVISRTGATIDSGVIVRQAQQLSGAATLSRAGAHPVRRRLARSSPLPPVRGGAAAAGMGGSP